MTSDQYRQVRDLFEAAIDLDPSSVPAWIDGVAADEVVRAELRSLWRHHLDAGAFLSRPIAEANPELHAEVDADLDPSLAPGTMVGVYRIIEETGRGGMGRVYRAIDTRLGRDVAVKSLPPSLTAVARHRDRLRREARAAASLAHPGICTVYALEERGDEVYIVSEFLDGETLREEIARAGRPGPDVVEATARALADALAAAHDRGIVHRDLKPENVMRTRDGHVKILDFGLARLPTPDTDAAAPVTMATLAGGMAGTPAYMAPEQLNGAPVDARSDVFALGVLLYEFATGVHPFAAATPLATAGRVLESPAPRLGERRPDVSRAVADVIHRALEKAPSARFASGRAVSAALREAPGRPAGGAWAASWWRAHQIVVIALYLAASIVAWQTKEVVRSAVPLSLFLLVGCAAMVGGILRGHLVFTAAVHPRRFDVERQRTGRAALVVDLLMAIALATDGLLLASASFVLYGLLTIALGIGIGLAAVWLEPATEAAAFEAGT